MSVSSATKTLDFLIPASEHTNSEAHSTNVANVEHIKNNTNKKHHHSPHHSCSSSSSAPCSKKERRPPPVIPPSPTLTAAKSHGHDVDTMQTDLILRKFELDTVQQTWHENTVASDKFLNPHMLQQHLDKFGLGTAKHQHASLIKHTNVNKTRIGELMEDAQSLHIVTQTTDVGCPAHANPNTKKGCWCIEEVRKQKKSRQQQYLMQQQQQQAQICKLTAPSLSSASHHHLLQQQQHHFLYASNLNPHFQHLSSSQLPSSLSHHTVRSNGVSTTLTTQQKALNLMQIYKTLNVNPSSSSVNTARVNGARSAALPKSASAASTAMGMIQNSLISNARTQHYTPSNRMQQIRMQQMLLNARTQPQPQPHTHASAVPVVAKHSVGNGSSVLGVRSHKDTFVFGNDKGSEITEPTTKRRKKSRWSNK